MPAWIHGRAEHLLAKNPSMPKGEAFAIATQQSHKAGKTPKGYGTAQGKREAKAKYDKPKKDYVKSSNPGGLETPKLSDKPKTRWTGSHLVKNKESCMGSKTASAMRNELISITMHKLGKEYIQGGKADGKTDADFPEDQLDMGQKVEMEHTNDPAMAREISRDHLEEFKDYYTRLAKMEDEAKKAKGEKTAEKDEDEGPGRGTNEKDVKAIREYMKARKPGSEDSNFHRFSEGRGLNVHEAEEAAYDMLGSAMNPTAG